MKSILTFYSYKGGVGRTMALANIAVLLARRGLRVLAVDWDLEAPGLIRYFQEFDLDGGAPWPGLIDILEDASRASGQVIEWRRYVHEVNVGTGQPLSLISSGDWRDPYYARRVLNFDWNAFFENSDGGEVIESLRRDWLTEFDVTLIDSRTGITDSGGVCTIQLPDALVIVFTANAQSLEGAKDVALRAQRGRQHLAYDRMPLLVLPLPSRFEGATEYEEGRRWLGRFVDQIGCFFEDWLPRPYEPIQFLERAKLPYVPYFSFGERLAVVSEGTSDPQSLGYAYAATADLIAAEFKNVDQIVIGGRLGSSQLPSPPPDFVGREPELREILDAIQRGASVCGLVGMGGVGKTALALKLGEALKARFPDGQIYLDLKGLDSQPLAPVEVQSRVIRALSSDVQIPASPDAIEGAYRSILEGKRVLLLLDNARDHRQVEPLLAPSGCLLILTSRTRFALPGMAITSLEPLAQAEARRFLLAAAPSIGDQADKLARLCGYLPLALRLVAALVAERPTIPPPDLSGRLAEAGARAELIETSVDSSYHILSEELQVDWRSLAIFPDTFDGRAAAELWGKAAKAGVDSLGSLVTFSLLEWSQDSGRYRLHNLLRDAASVRLSADERARLERLHSAYYRDQLSSYDNLYLQGGVKAREGLASVEIEWPNISAGQVWAAGHAQEDRRAADICSSYPLVGFHVLTWLQSAEERLRWQSAGLTAARKLTDLKSASRHLTGLGGAYADLKQPHRAIECSEEALAVAQQMGDQRTERDAMTVLGVALRQLRAYRRAIDYLERSLVIDRQIGDRRNESGDLDNLGLTYDELGDHMRAVAYHEHSLAIAQEVGDRMSESTVLVNLANSKQSVGDHLSASTYYERGMELARQLGERQIARQLAQRKT